MSENFPPSWSSLIASDPTNWQVARSSCGSRVLIFPESHLWSEEMAWCLRANISQDDLKMAWDSILDIVAKYGLAVRLGEDCDGCFFAIDVNLSSQQKGLAWSYILAEIESRWIDHHILKGLSFANDRPIVDSGYFSVRNNHGYERDHTDCYDYNPESQKGVFWDVLGASSPVAPSQTFLPVLWPGPWSLNEEDQWFVTGSVLDLVAIKRASLVCGEMIYLSSYSDSSYQLIYPQDRPVLKWWDWSSLTDLYRLSLRLRVLWSCFVGVHARLDDERCAYIYFRADFSFFDALFIHASRYGLIVEKEGDMFKVFLPTRRVIWQWIMDLDDETDVLMKSVRSIPLILEKSLLTDLSVVTLTQLKKNLSPLDPSLVAAGQKKMSGNKVEQRQREMSSQRNLMSDALKKQGIKKVTVIKDAERVVTMREKEMGAVFAEDPKSLNKEVLDLLREVQSVNPKCLSSQDKGAISRAITDLSSVNKMKGGQMLAFKAVKQTSPMLDYIAKKAQDEPSQFPNSLGSRLSSVSGRVQSRKMEGRPDLHMTITESELKRMKEAKLASKRRDLFSGPGMSRDIF